MSKIEWTNKTWNPVVGCSKVSPGCKNCYAIRMAWRLQHIHHSADKYAGTVEKTANSHLNWTGRINMIESELVKPFKWKKPSMIFVNSQSDLFHESIPFEFVRKVFGVMSVCDWHTFQILTKRPKRMVDFFEWMQETDPDWQNDPAHETYDLCDAYGIETGCGSAFETEAWPLKNVWLGVSVENQQTADERIPFLLKVPAAVRFLSCEPLLGPVRLDMLSRQEYDMTFYDNCLTGFKAHGAGGWHAEKIDWVIVGGESGKDARPMHPDWVRSLQDQCQKASTAFFFKQWGEWLPNNNYTGDGGKPLGRFFDNEFKHGNCVWDGNASSICMTKVGKKIAGRQIDGREWNYFPRQQNSPISDDPDIFFTGADY